jgi:ribosome-binding protein aMBF1 (putative translation factor)
MEHQDWESIIVKIQNPPKTDDKKNNYVKSKESKLEEQVEEGKLSHKKMDSNYGKALQKKRLSKGMTQKDLAKRINVPFKMINEIESGKAKHNGQLMNKLNRVFQ